MALFDDKRFLLSHIRHSFITGDDTGVCEAVMLNEILPHRDKLDEDSDLLEELTIETKSELENAQSFDIVSNIDIYGSHRRRSNTAQRLERLKLDKKNKAKVQVVQWKNANENLSLNEQEVDDYFPIRDVKEIKLEKENIRNKKSLLSKQMAKYPTPPVNPFNEYARFDARISETNGNSKRLTIYLTMLKNEEERKKPIFVEVINTAKIQDLIGLICWQLTNIHEGKEPLLKSKVSNYCLRIAEENGEVDQDFPPLSTKEPVAKFGFTVLALEERKIDQNSNSLITVHIDQVFTKIEPPKDQDLTANYIIEEVIRKRKLSSDQNFILKRINTVDEYIDPSTKLSELKDKEFRLVPIDEQSTTSSNVKITDINEIPDLEAIEATLYKCFNVIAIQKYSNAVEVQLGISGKKVDVTPYNPNVKQSSNKFWKVFQTKPTSFNVENIVECFIVKPQDSHLPENRSFFKINYLNGNSIQTLKFETNTDTANKIVNKINHLMKMRSSRKRNELLKFKK